MDGYVFDTQKTPAAVFGITDSGMKHITQSALSRRGVLFICQTAGNLKYVSGGGERILSEGSVFVCQADEGHTFVYDPFENSKTVYFAADGKLVYDLMALYGVSAGAVFKAPEAAEAAAGICRIMSDPSYDEEEKEAEAAVVFHRFVYKLRRAARFSGKERENTAGAIKAYIDSHLESKITLEEMSGIFFISKTQIFRVFREAYGMAPMQYFLKQKIELSKEMLEKTELRVSEIAEALSFTDAKHFSKTFKKFTGELPRNYRRAVKAKKNGAENDR